MRTSGDNLIIDICRNEEEPAEDWDDDGTGWLATLAPLRADVLSGDLRLFYILWLAAVQEELVSEDDVEPLPGIRPLTGALEGLAEFFHLDPDLVQAAAECGAGEEATSRTELRASLAAIPEDEKTALLLRVVEGDGHVAAELRRGIRKQRPLQAAPRRTVAQLRARAEDIAEARERAEAQRHEAERRRQAEEDERARHAPLELLRRRGKGVWREVEQEIERRNASGYDNAAGLLTDLQALAVEQGQRAEYARQLASIRLRHSAKRKLLERLVKLG